MKATTKGVIKMIVPTDEEMYTQANRAAAVMDNEGSRFRRMAYEEGVHATLEWVLGNTIDLPLTDETYGDLDEDED